MTRQTSRKKTSPLNEHNNHRPAKRSQALSPVCTKERVAIGHASDLEAVVGCCTAWSTGAPSKIPFILCYSAISSCHHRHLGDPASPSSWLRESPFSGTAPCGIVSINIPGLMTRVINCHLSNSPEEQNRQLQITEEEERCVGHRRLQHIRGSSSDIGSGAVEVFAELLDRTALVYTVTIFDAAYLPTRVSSYGIWIDVSRLNRVLILSRLSRRVTTYWTLKYRCLEEGPPSPYAHFFNQRRS
ncbi:hypothetical protein LAZ67_13000520 [Cordylochernes scorpioides]|uniref:Uncharacterized protein n=1 Tax=Cordylochernes scorpioides TaxID=51811 RepID=A0ABY6L2Z9_9ARAC|nr:hypothetical protein LAZ67_13000520 [Cordylochernes scorpioides]